MGNFGTQNLDENMQMASFKKPQKKKKQGTVIEFIRNQVGLKAQSL
jgi:hypothetical protein